MDPASVKPISSGLGDGVGETRSDGDGLVDAGSVVVCGSTDDESVEDDGISVVVGMPKSVDVGGTPVMVSDVAGDGMTDSTSEVARGTTGTVSGGKLGNGGREGTDGRRVGTAGGTGGSKDAAIVSIVVGVVCVPSVTNVVTSVTSCRRWKR